MNNQEQNWTNLFGDLPDGGISWYGTWTRYAPTQEVLTSFQAVRNFVPNEDNTVITHTNNLTYADGSTEEKQWQINKTSCNQPDGIIHPASASARALSFEEGATIWTCKTLEPGKFFGGELFFRYQDWRTSVVIAYGEKSEFARITQIREHLGSFTNQLPAAKVENLSGKWTGTKQSMNPDLSISATEEIEGLDIDPTQGKNETFFLPDAIVVNCPKQVQVGEEFELVAGKLVAEDQYKRLTVKYDQKGAFSKLISEVCNRQI